MLQKLFFLALLSQVCKGEDANDDYKDFFEFLRVPTVSFANGEYYGQSLEREANGDKVPHGIGSYISSAGKVLYAGSWFNGTRNTEH